MALKLLQPGLQPFGQFDLKDGEVVKGGEYGNLVVAGGAEVGAADVTEAGPLSSGTTSVMVQKGPRLGVGGLLDDGVEGYGTSVGTLIGATVGHGTGYGTMSTAGVVVIGPQTTTGSGKISVWHAAGLYGVSGTPAADLDGLAVNAELEADADGLLVAEAGGTVLGYAVGHMSDPSIVSTSTFAATGTASTEFYAMYLKAL